VIGSYSDRVGRRPAMILSLVMMGFAIIARDLPAVRPLDAQRFTRRRDEIPAGAIIASQRSREITLRSRKKGG
jgi:hypothetical protein